MLDGKTLLEKLEKQFEEYKRRFDILRWVDEAAIEERLSLKDFFFEFCVRLEKLVDVEKVGVYGVSEKSLLPVKFEDGGRGHRRTPYIPKEFELPEGVLGGGVRSVEVCGDGKESHNTLLVPVRCRGEVLFTVVLQDCGGGCTFGDEVVSFYEDVGKRISILVEYKEDKRIEKIKDQLVSSIFEKQLEPRECWGIITDHIASFLPDCSPFRIEPAPLVQVLTYKPGDRFMLLRATQDESIALNRVRKDRIAIPLKVEETICGLLIEQDKDVLLVNPRKEHSHRYQAYLFGADVPGSELVVAVGDGEVIALLNLEHADESAFNAYSVALLRKVAEILAPLVRALLIQEDVQRNKTISLLYVMTDLLRRMASAYRHKVQGLLLKSRLMIGKIVEESEALEGNMGTYVSNLRQFVDEFQERSNLFLRDLPNYVTYGGIDICQAIFDVMREFDAEALEKKEGIHISLDGLEYNPRVYASRMLKEHIYNLANNSLDAVRQSIRRDRIKEGRIRITMRKEKVEDAQKKETSPSRIYVEIEDNGGGCSKEAYAHIEDFGYTTKRQKGGSGYGLPAAKEYIKSIGGNLQTTNIVDEGFKVVFYLQEFDTNYHKELIKKIAKGDQDEA